MTKTLLALLAATGLGLSFSSTSHAATDTDYCVDYEWFYEDSDFIDDGMLDDDEYAELGDEWYDDWDVDDSGDVNESEFQACYDAIGWDVGDTYASWDADDSGGLDEEEFFGEDAYDDWDADDDDEVQIGEWF